MRGGARSLALALALALAGGAAPATTVPEAVAALEAVRERLEAARGQAARVAALAAAVRAHEQALSAMRAGLRALAAEDRRLSGELAAEHDRLTTLLGALQSLGRAPRAALLAYPGGPVRAARAAGVMGALSPELAAEVEALAARLDGLRAVRTSQEVARAQAEATLADLQRLRGEALRAARGEGRMPPATALRRQAAEAAARAEDLAGLAAALRTRLPAGAGRDAAPAAFAARRGELPPPVSGPVVTGFGGTDPWGRTGEGVTFEAPAWAMVTAPAAATVRYAGPLVGYGTVAILEPAPGWLMVLAGLGSVERTVGETVLEGERLGDMGGPLPRNTEFFLDAAEADGQTKRRYLYVELRRDGEAVDPAPWFGPAVE